MTVKTLTKPLTKTAEVNDKSVQLTLQTTETGTKGILASELYKNLAPNGRDFARWVDRNIVKNQYLVKNVDWVEITEVKESGICGDGGTRNPGRPRVREKNYILSLEAAKKISLSTKTPRQQEIVDTIVKFTAAAPKDQMISAAELSSVVAKMVSEAMMRMNSQVTTAQALMIENQKKDDAIRSLQVGHKVKGSALDSQTAIRKIAVIIAKESPIYNKMDNAYQVVHNRIMQIFFGRHPVKWKSIWYALKDKEFAKEEFARVKKKTDETISSKLDWVRLLHPAAMVLIENCARDLAVQSLPEYYWLEGGTLPQ